MIVSLLMAPQSAGLLSQLRRGVADVLLLSRQLTKVIYQNRLYLQLPLKALVLPGRGGAPVKERSHRTGSCQDDRRCGHVGGGEHQRSPHGKRPHGADILQTQRAVRLTVRSLRRRQMISTKESLLSILNRFCFPSSCFLAPPPPLPSHRVTLLSLHLQILKGLEMESRMHIRFLDVDTSTMRCGKSSS